MSEHEDKLSHDERLRLECLAQAVALSAMRGPRTPDADQITAAARVFEMFVQGGVGRGPDR